MTTLAEANAPCPGRARLFTVPPGRPFLSSLATAILRGDLPAPGGPAPDPLSLSGMTVLLPTRRATRALQEAFLAASGLNALLLPRLSPIAEGEDDLTLLTATQDAHAFAAAGAEIAPAVSEIERLLVLTQLVLKWSEARRRVEPGADFLSPQAVAAGSTTPAQAAQLAAELARLMDMIETENVDLAGLDKLVPDEFSAHWQETIDFLKIVTSTWPAHLAECGLTSPAVRRNLTILAEARRLTLHPPSGPVIVAGVTGSIPATAGLMRAVGNLGNGAIVLPGLDLSLDEESWRAIVPAHPEHPQFGLKMLLDRLGAGRQDVAVLAGSEPCVRSAARAAFISEVMRPASSTQLWHTFAAKTGRHTAAQALEGISLIEAPSPQDEAEAVALILREAAETPGRTAALVSPDRLLARRVAVRLEAWGIRVDDSAGRPFAKTVPGAFLDLVIEAMAQDFAPAALVALLKHPLTRLGLAPFDVRRAGRALELAVFRTAYLGRGLDCVETSLERARQDVASGHRRHAAVRRLWDADWDGARDLVQRLQRAYQPLIDLFSSHAKHPLATLAAAHAAVAEAVAALTEAEGLEHPGSPLYTGEAGSTASLLFASLADPAVTAPAVLAADYPDFYRSLIAAENVRARVPLHPRLFIWGPFEARLQQTDIVILGSLNDGTWPEAADPGPWLNRAMRKSLGLPSPEEKIGFAAHDFTSLLGAGRVYLTRAQRYDGVPAVPSRWLMRLNALLEGMGQVDALRLEQPWVRWARSRDHISRRIQIAAPEPRPDVSLRPRKLSVSAIEKWIANPYTIFARNILHLEPLPPLGEPPDAALKGSIIHEACSRFTARYPEQLPPDPLQSFLAIADEVIGPFAAHPRVAAFWRPRLHRFARWFVETEPERRSGVTRISAEVSGAHVIAAGDRPFTLTARADRIDLSASGVIITDYKTGQVPNDSRVNSGAAPQLPLEAAIAIAGGFESYPAQPVRGLRYIRASGGEPPGEQHDIKSDSIVSLAGSALTGLERLVSRFDDPATPYKAVRRAGFNYSYDEYAHLARAAEWAAQWDEET